MKLDKEKIKRYSKVAQYCVIALCWLMALIGISAYAVYWCRANVNYETSQNNKLDSIEELPKRQAVNNTDGYKFYSLKSYAYLNTAIDLNNNANSWRSYLSFYAHTQDWSSVAQYRAVYDGEFYFKNMDNTIQYTRLDFYFDYDESVDTVYLVNIVALTSNPTTSTFLFRNVNNVYVPITLIVHDFTYRNTDNCVSETYHGSLLDYCFDLVFDMNNSTSFEFKENYNFNALVSENITGDSNLIVPYKLSFNGDPTDELIYAFVKFDFVSNNYVYKGVYLEFRKPYLVRYNGQDNQVNFYGSTSQLMVSRVYYLRSLPSSLDSYPSASTMDLVCSRHTYGQKEISIGEGQSNINAMIYGTDYIWTNDAYRLVYIENTDYNSYYDVVTMPLLNSVDNSLYNPYLYRGLELYQVLNNGYLTYELGTLTYQVGDTHLGDVFTLYTQAFTGLMPILNIQILPSFTLGMLLFIPLVITIIIVILRLVKK